MNADEKNPQQNATKTNITHYEQMEFIPGMQAWFNMCKSTGVIELVNKMGNKIIESSQLIQKKKAFDKIQHSFIIKIINKVV